MRPLLPCSTMLLCLLLLLPATPARSQQAAPENPYPGYESAIYADPAHWLCRPDQDDVCDTDLDAASVLPNGRARVRRPFRLARRPRIDCFYVYPTISADPMGNSDLVPAANQELAMVRQQAARLGSVCRVYAPVYRQVTLTALLSNLSGNPIPSDSALAQADVIDAWRHYVANDNEGRGVLLIGHSQGASRLIGLLQDEVDDNPALRERLVSAMLLGTSFQVPTGADVGGDLQNIPLCRSSRDVGCVISYSSFRATAPPPPNSFFGVSRQPGFEAACTNPASLEGGMGRLEPYFPSSAGTWVDPALGVEITAPFVTLPRFLRAECVRQGGFHVLSILVDGDPADPRADDIGGDLTPEWGLHIVDAHLAMGNLVRIARRQAAVWRKHAARRSR